MREPQWERFAGIRPVLMEPQSECGGGRSNAAPVAQDATGNLVGAAAEALDHVLVRDPDRVAAGPHELREFAPALRKTLAQSLAASGTAGEVLLGARTSIADWNRPDTQVDLAVRSGNELTLVAELKVWDIGHQLFDVAKICCLLNAGAGAGFLLCIARTPGAFEHSPGGELFPANTAPHHDAFPVILERHATEARRHLRQGRPRPTSLPRRFSTRAVCAPVTLDAYPEHQLRAVEVRIEDPTPASIPSELMAVD